MQDIENISAVLIVKNEEKVLAECLRSLERFPEVVIYINDTTDKSEVIAKSFPNTKVVTGPFLASFAATRNAAISHTCHDWVFNIDADERCTPELIGSIAGFSSNYPPPYLIAKVVMFDFFMGKKFPNKICKRLFNKNYYQFTRQVHEDIEPINPTSATTTEYSILHGDLNHQLPDFKKMCAKCRYYAKLAAAAGKPRRSILVSFVTAGYKFLLYYLFRGGFLKGKAGLLYACVYYYAAYSKYRIPR